MTVIKIKCMFRFLFMIQTHLNDYNNHVQLESTINQNTQLNVYKCIMCILSLIKCVYDISLCKHFLQMIKKDHPKSQLYQSLAFILFLAIAQVFLKKVTPKKLFVLIQLIIKYYSNYFYRIDNN